MFNFIKNIFKKKPKEVCPHCKGTGEILRPAMQIGKMIEYDVQRCICQKKKR